MSKRFVYNYNYYHQKEFDTLREALIFSCQDAMGETLKQFGSIVDTHTGREYDSDFVWEHTTCLAAVRVNGEYQLIKR